MRLQKTTALSTCIAAYALRSCRWGVSTEAEASLVRPCGAHVQLVQILSRLQALELGHVS